MNEKNKVLEALRKAMATCNGVNDTVAMLYGANGRSSESRDASSLDGSAESRRTKTIVNDSPVAASAFVGDGDVLSSTLLCVLNHVGEGRATPAEMAITRAVLMAVAAADVQNNGALQEAIDGHREDIKAGKLILTRGGEKPE